MKPSFKPLKTRYRATFAAGATTSPRLGKVDRDNLTLHDVQITLEGEAKGHGVWLDREFCEAVAARGNEIAEKNGAGVKVRFGHPAMCSDALGTYLGRAANFRVVDVTRKDSGETAAGVIADVALDANADRTEWIMNMAESAPDTFGQSIIFEYADWCVKDADGNRHYYKAEVADVLNAWSEENPDASYREYAAKEREIYDAWMAKSADGKIYAVFGELLGTDFTDTPAATDGVFSDTSLAAEAERLLEEHPQIAETLENHPDNVYQFLSRIGILDKIESKRVAGLQAAKDKELAEMSAKYKADILAMKASHEAAMAENDAAQAAALTERDERIKNLLADTDAKQKALAEAQAKVEQLSAKCAEADKALSETKAALDAETKRYREQVGLAMQPAKKLRTAAEISKDENLTPAERSRLLAEGQYS